MADRQRSRWCWRSCLSLSSGRCKVAILISGSGTNLQSFIDQVDDLQLNCDISVVFSNCEDAYGLVRAKKAGIATAALSHKRFSDREDFDKAVAKILDEHAPDLIILAGFMRILSAWFVRRYEGKILNIHPALLPLYPGLHTHERVLDAGDSHHGSTVHFVTEELDGGPRILAGRIKVLTNESPEELRARVQAVEHRIYPQAAQLFAEGQVSYRNGEVWMNGNIMAEPLLVDY